MKQTERRPAIVGKLDRNIEALLDRQARDREEASREEKVAAAITRFVGSMLFVYLHILFFGLWITVNLGFLPVLPPFDSSLVVLAMFASVEAIFLSTFVLISQNRMSAAADKRADLNLQISLLAEHEATQLIAMVSAIARHLQIPTEADGEIEELTREVVPDQVLDHIEKKAEDGKAGGV
ncbi:DUF1003 domain-containing protein [Rhizobium sp. S-51]|uniref:DUF1003 domain-containing protein n=1 Tax=Rhizobium terricola TaxID=2728849 RepID=A0A7Y0AYK2_9HYPH|nr:DUF1003 domain-containing protein [Rhizobium terricola]NML75710.1 DUF1003 domain-containing protein [Rhizobium terricola]